MCINLTYGTIDTSIFDIIYGLNAAGYETLYSCSGLLKDHTSSAKNMAASAYVLFARSLPTVYIEKLKECCIKYNLSFETNYPSGYVIRFPKSYHLSEQTLMQGWQMLYNELVPADILTWQQFKDACLQLTVTSPHMLLRIWENESIDIVYNYETTGEDKNKYKWETRMEYYKNGDIICCIDDVTMGYVKRNCKYDSMLENIKTFLH